MDFLLRLDTYLTLLINSAHHPFFDQFFFNFSEKWMWIPLYLSIIVVLFRKEGKQAWWMLLALAMVVVLSDQISSGVLKPWVERLRPSHDPLLVSQIHLVNNYTGGLYGFVSSHAANTAGIALFLALLLRDRMLISLLAIWAILTAYSRVYLGVHFVGDVVCGACVGLFSGFMIYTLFLRLKRRFNLGEKRANYSTKETLPILVIFILTVVIIFLKPI